jgi:hypothetical protein
MKNGVFWDVTLRGPHLVFIRSVRQLLVTASVVPSSPILVTLMMEALSFSETSVLARTTRRNISEEAILRVPMLVHISGIFVRSIKFAFLYVICFAITTK